MYSGLEVQVDGRGGGCAALDNSFFQEPGLGAELSSHVTCPRGSSLATSAPPSSGLSPISDHAWILAVEVFVFFKFTFTGLPAHLQGSPAEETEGRGSDL